MRQTAADELRLQPISRVFGSDCGTPIDRYYIERFLQDNSALIRGSVLEVGDASYTRRFGGARVTKSDVLHATTGNRHATIVGDLETGRGLRDSAFDCIILTQVLPFIFDLRAAVQHCHRALAPGGVVLATVPGISQISRYDMDRWGDFWRFTNLSAQRLFADAFGPESVDVQHFGNVRVATRFLEGFSLEEMTAAELDTVDPDYQLIITIRARRPETP